MKLKTLCNPVWSTWKARPKLLMVMKLTAILLLSGILHLSAASYSQTVSISKRTTSVEKVLKEIKSQTGFLFFYNAGLLENTHDVTVELNNVPLERALDACLLDQNLSYNIVNKTIVISAKEELGNLTNEAKNELIKVKGKVVNSENQNPIAGVGVIPKNTTGGTSTSDNGEFELSVEKGTTLIFTSVGFKYKEVTVTDNKFLTVQLDPMIVEMGDVIVTGYQSLKKETYTGNAITIKGQELKKLNPQNVLKAVQSFDPSFRLMDNNLLGSDPNALPRINVRGATVLPTSKDDLVDKNKSSDNLPAFILDGFEVTVQKVMDMDINRIESITLLKDAAATAVYGSRAANGVMIITTRAPKEGKLELSYNYELNGTAADISDYHVLNAEQKLEYEKLAGLYDGSNPSTALPGDVLEGIYYNKKSNVVSGINTYWLSQPLTNTLAHKHSLYAQGGSKTFRYGIDMRYQTMPGVMNGSERNRYNLGMNFNYTLSDKLLFKNEITLTQVNAANSPYGSFSTYAEMNPYYPKSDSKGNMIREVDSWRINTQQPGEKQFKTIAVLNPLYEAGLKSFDKSSYLEIIDAFSAEWLVSQSFKVKSVVALTKNRITADKFVSPFSNEFYNYTNDKLGDRGTYKYENRDQFKVDGNVTLSYNKQVEDHFFNLALGANVISAEDNFKSVEAMGFSNDRFSNIGFARTYTTNTAPQGNINLSRQLGSFFSGNYSYKNKYLLDASAKIEGSSAFGTDKKYAPFWAVGTGWNIHKEGFLENSNVISQLKLRATIGTTGSVSFPPFLSKSLYSYQNSNWYSTGIGAVVNGYGNNNLSWQKTNNYDLGIDLGFFKDRLVFSPRYYYKLTKGLLTDVNLAPSTGFTTYKENLGDMSNIGYELYLTYNAFKSTNWNVNLTANLAHNTNKIVKISNSLKAFNSAVDKLQQDSGYTSTPLVRYNEGQSIFTIYGVRSLGIDPENGKELFVKKDGSLTHVWDVKDVVPVGDETPLAEGYIGSNITYKQFMVSFSFKYRLGGEMYNQTLVDRVENADPRYNVDSRVLALRWKKPGDIALYKNIADLGISNISSRFVQKYNFLELQTVYLAYDFQKELIKRMRFQALRASLTMNDIFRASSIQIERGIDYPFARSLTLSLQATF